MAKKKLPIYKLVVTDNEESGVNMNSFVEQPATEQDFLMFSKDEKLNFKVDPERRIVTGAMMVSDTPIYRNNGVEEFMVVFEKETIEKIVQKFMKDGFNKNVNTDHTTPVEGVTMYESFITDSERGILAPKGFPKVPEGSWFASYKVDNDDVWAKVLDGTFKGFSVEGVFNKQLVKMDKDLNLNNNKMSDKKNEMLEGLKSFISKYSSKEEVVEVKMTENILEDGETMVVYDAEVIATGVVVSLVDSEGQLQAMPQGSYVLQDGTTFDIVDEEGTADNVVLAEAPAEEGAEEAAAVPAATGADMKETNATGTAKRVVETTIKESNFNEEEMKELEELKAEFAELKKGFEAIVAEKAEFAKESELAAEAKKIADAELKEFYELVKKIADEPAAEPTVSKPAKFNATTQKKSFKEDLAELRK
jgi:hypothetical protein